MKKFIIDGKNIGENHPCYIVAEVGSNHNGDLEIAKKLIDIAAESEANAVKFQLFEAEKIASTIKQDIPLDDKVETSNLSEFYKPYELPREWIAELVDYCEIKKITLLATPFDHEAIELMEEYNFPAYKIASFEIVDLELIKHAAETGKPVILSTGMASIEDIDDAVQACYSVNNHQVGILHCGIGYPLNFDSVNLLAINTLRNRFNVPIGYSDHTLGISVPIASISLGVDIYEKHFTFDKTAHGPDHEFALSPEELIDMVKGMREAEKALGSSEKIRLPEEEIHYIRGRRSLHSSRDIEEGQIITKEDLIALRPGLGLKPKLLKEVVGKKASKRIPKHTAITWECIES